MIWMYMSPFHLIQICRTMLHVWDHDGDGVVNIRDFVHTFAYAQLVKSFLFSNTKGTENDRMDYIFRSVDFSDDGGCLLEDVNCRHFDL